MLSGQMSAQKLKKSYPFPGDGCGKEGLASETRALEQRRLVCMGTDDLAGRLVRGGIFGNW